MAATRVTMSFACSSAHTLPLLLPPTSTVSESALWTRLTAAASAGLGQPGQGCSLDGNNHQSRDTPASWAVSAEADSGRTSSGIRCGHGKHGEDRLRGACMHQGSRVYYAGFSSKTLLLKSAHAIRKPEGWMKAQRTNRNNAGNLWPDSQWTEHPSAGESTCTTAVSASTHYH